MPELERLMLQLSFTDLCRIYDYAIADATGEELPALPAYLHEVVAALRDRVWSSRADAHMLQLGADVPAWLAAQQERQPLKERSA